MTNKYSAIIKSNVLDMQNSLPTTIFVVHVELDLAEIKVLSGLIEKYTREDVRFITSASGTKLSDKDTFTAYVRVYVSQFVVNVDIVLGNICDAIREYFSEDALIYIEEEEQ